MRRAVTPLTGLQVVFRAPLWPLLGQLRYVLYSVTTPSAPGAFFPAGPDDRWVYAPGVAMNDVTTAHADVLAAMIRVGAGADVDVGIERVVRSTRPARSLPGSASGGPFSLETRRIGSRRAAERG